MNENEPCSAPKVRSLCREILTEGEVVFTRHAHERMAERSLERIDITNVLRGGAVGTTEQENGSWRYHITTPRIEVVIAFRSTRRLVVVTAWRIEP